MANVKGVLKTLFPYISTAAELGGPLGTMAASTLGKAIGVDVAPTPEAITDALTKSGATPDQLLAAKKAEDDFQVQMASLGYKNISDLEAIDEQDRVSARQREIAVRDYTPEIGFYLLSIIFAYALHWLFKYEVPGNNKALVYTMLGSLGTILVMSATYFYGTTRGSENKSNVIANLKENNHG